MRNSNFKATGIAATFFSIVGFGVYQKWQEVQTPARVPPVATVPSREAVKTEPQALFASKVIEVLLPAGAKPEEEEEARALITLFNVGNYGKALAQVDANLSRQDLSDSYRKWLASQLPTVLIAEGWLMLRQNQCEGAISLLARAETLKGGPDASKGLAICFYKLRDIPSSVDKFAIYAAARPGDRESLMLYADALESDQRFGEAWQILDKLSKEPDKLSDQDWKQVVFKRDRMAARTRESQQQATTGSRHFVLLYRTQEHRDVANFAIETLERAHDEFVTNYGFRSLNSPVEVSLYPSDGFRSLTGGPSWSDGLFDGRIRIPIQKGEDTSNQRLQRVLRHELLHAMLAIQSDHRPIPTWFNEGLAQSVECSGTPCGFRTFSAMPGDLLSMQQLESPYISLPAVAAAQAYTQSRYLVTVLLREMTGEGIRPIIEGVSGQGTLSSDILLKPAGLTFSNLLERAAPLWKQQVALP